jgi:D-alanine-D-alanine ligase-like ATP-grasp enzyme
MNAFPCGVTGNGYSTITTLLRHKTRVFQKNGRGTIIRTGDPRIAAKLKRMKLSFDSILPKGKSIFLLDNANLSTGGDAIDVTHSMHPGFKKVAIAVTRDMGLKLCGVDIIVDGDITKKPKKYWILETNAAPGLDHYVLSGTAQSKIVEDMYLEVLKSIERRG